jgi:molecular chaperone GrpE
MRPSEENEQGTGEPRPAGPVAAGDPPPPARQEGVPPTTPPTGDELEQDVTALLSKAEGERDEYLELAQRAKADFENFRKRMNAEVQAAQVRGKSQVALEVIEAVDNLERALEAAGEGEDLAAGLEMVLGGLRETLARNGVEAVDPKGEKFDPNRHEALSTQPVEGAESGVVLEVLQKGYTLGDQLVRPARVVVSS